MILPRVPQCICQSSDDSLCMQYQTRGNNSNKSIVLSSVQHSLLHAEIFRVFDTDPDIWNGFCSFQILWNISGIQNRTKCWIRKCRNFRNDSAKIFGSCDLQCLEWSQTGYNNSNTGSGGYSFHSVGKTDFLKLVQYFLTSPSIQTLLAELMVNTDELRSALENDVGNVTHQFVPQNVIAQFRWNVVQKLVQKV